MIYRRLLTRVVYQNASVLTSPDLVASDFGIAARSVGRIEMMNIYN